MKKLLIATFLFSLFQINAQYNLKFKIEGLPDTTIFLAKYFGDRLYYADTTESKGGIAQFKKDNYDGGVYAVICPGPKYFEFIMADKNVEMETKMDDFITNMKVKKSEENQIFYNYIQYINKKKPRSMELMKKRDSLDKKKDKKEIEDINNQLKKLDDEVKAYQHKLVDEHKDMLIGKILNMSIDHEIPEKIQENDSLRYQYYKSHFWDNIDLSDWRLVNSPVFHNKLDFYFQKVLIQQPDTICENAHKVISQIKEGTDMFKYVVHYITYNYETSKIMGMDAVFECMAHTYYCPMDSSKAYWVKKDKLKEICERADAIEPLLIGKPAPRIILADTTEKNWIDLYGVKNKYTILVFWADDCGHCKKEMPKLKKLYDELKAKGVDVEVYAVGTSLENDGWREFIRKYKLNWINVSDTPDAHDNPRKYLYDLKVTDLKSLNFRKTYDIFSTPQIYLLDENKKIIGKKLDSKTLANILERMLKIELKFNDEVEEDDDKSKTH